MAIPVIIPVYNGIDIVKKCINSVIASKVANQSDIEIVVIYDCSGEVCLEELLSDYLARGEITLYQNSENLGFVKTVNKGFKYTAKRDCIILNSDTEVYGDWVDRLINIASEFDAVGSITPFTNNGEICSFPKLCVDNVLPKHVDLGLLDKSFSENEISEIQMPTGVGFCMYISREALDQVGFFDEDEFGRGYGEENDLCQRFVAAGYKNLLAENVFVFHSGGESFGAEKNALIEAAVKKVDKRYPSYLPDVHQFIADDQPRFSRVSALANYFSRSDNCVLSICHGKGGGTKRYIDELSGHVEGASFFRLYPVDGGRVCFEFPAWAGLTGIHIDPRKDKKFFADLLKFIGFNLVHVNHIMGVEALVFDLLEVLSSPVFVTLHDYYFIAGSPVLYDDVGVYNEDTAIAGGLRNRVTENNITFMSCERWNASVEKLFQRADKIISPSEYVSKVYSVAYPEFSYSLVEHVDKEVFGLYPAVTVNKSGSVLRVAVVGALSKEKGADFFERIAVSLSKKQSNIEFYLIGYSYRDLDSCIHTTGAYAEEDLDGILDEIKPDVIWFPAMWAETYSYTLSLVLERGFPVVVPKIGAQYVRVKNRPYSFVFDSYDTAYIEGLFSDLWAELKLAGEVSQWPQAEKEERFYLENYVTYLSANDSASLSLPPKFLSALNERLDNTVDYSFRLRLVKILFALKSHRFFGFLFALIPYELQRFLKNKIYRGSVHD